MQFPIRLVTSSSSILRSILAVLAITLGLASQTASAAVNPQEQQIFNNLKYASGQGRPFVVLDPILCKVAREKAADMANRDYYSHTTPEGYGPNYLVRRAGYVLPDSYNQSIGANNIESVAAGRASAGDAWGAWMDSSSHRSHLLGQTSFYAGQTSVGVGFVDNPGSRYRYYWVVITAPPMGPSISFRTPKEVTTPSITLTGETDGKPAASKVQVALENSTGTSAWADAAGTASWSISVDGLTPGANTLRVRSLSSSGEVLKSVERNIRYVVVAPLTVNVSGEGSVTRGFEGTTSREVGSNIAISAKPAAGNLFTGWTGSVTASTPSIQFTMAEGFTLTANFIPNPFVAGRGSYSGFVTTSNGTPSVLNLKLAASGQFTGKLKVGDQTYSVRGAFDALGHATVTTSAGGQTISIDLSYTNTDGATHIAGSINGSDWTASINSELQGKPADPSLIGRYTVVLRADPDTQAPAPKGDGFATGRVSASGTSVVTGVLADGTPFTASGRLTRSGALNLFVAPYRHHGHLVGTLHFRGTTTSDVDGGLFWSRPAQVNPKSTAFTDGFTTTTTAVGAKYSKPKQGEPIVQVSTDTNNTEIELGDGGLNPVVQPATLTTSNQVIVSSPALDNLSVRVSAPTGQFRGRFTHPSTGTSTTFRGVVVQKQNTGFGFFLSEGGSGYATFAPMGAAR